MFTFSLIVLVIVGLLLLSVFGGIGAAPKPDKKKYCAYCSRKIGSAKECPYCGGESCSK